MASHHSLTPANSNSFGPGLSVGVPPIAPHVLERIFTPLPIDHSDEMVDHDSRFRDAVLAFIHENLIALGVGFIAGASSVVGLAYLISLSL